MIYNFDFLTHDEHDTIEEFSDDTTDNLDSKFISQGPDPFGDFELNENHSILFYLVIFCLLLFI